MGGHPKLEVPKKGHTKRYKITGTTPFENESLFGQNSAQDA